MAGKSRLGTVVHQKTAAVLAVTDVQPKDENELQMLCEVMKVIPVSRYY